MRSPFAAYPCVRRTLVVSRRNFAITQTRRRECPGNTPTRRASPGWSNASEERALALLLGKTVAEAEHMAKADAVGGQSRLKNERLFRPRSEGFLTVVVPSSARAACMRPDGSIPSDDGELPLEDQTRVRSELLRFSSGSPTARQGKKTTPPLRGLLKKPLLGVATPQPPLSGGLFFHLLVGGHRFYPPDKGGWGVAFPVERGVPSTP